MQQSGRAHWLCAVLSMCLLHLQVCLPCKNCFPQRLHPVVAGGNSYTAARATQDTTWLCTVPQHWLSSKRAPTVELMRMRLRCLRAEPPHVPCLPARAAGGRGAAAGARGRRGRPRWAHRADRARRLPAHGPGRHARPRRASPASPCVCGCGIHAIRNATCFIFPAGL